MIPGVATYSAVVPGGCFGATARLNIHVDGCPLSVLVAPAIHGREIARRGRSFGFEVSAKTRDARRGCSFDLQAIYGSQVKGTTASNETATCSGSNATHSGSIAKGTPAPSRALGPIRAIHTCMTQFVTWNGQSCGRHRAIFMTTSGDPHELQRAGCLDWAIRVPQKPRESKFSVWSVHRAL